MRSAAEIAAIPGLRVVRVGPDGGAGWIRMGSWTGSVIWSTHGGWDHVSVSPRNRSTTPSWDDMRELKGLFFRDDEWAVEYHPPAAENVNLVENCLHLWRPQDGSLPTPP